jgi:hypothetical protein
MDILNQLAAALGLAGLAGINLYLTVLVAGLAIHNGWIALEPAYQNLEILGHPAIIIVAGALYFLEFFADKIPWVDSLWDAIHTVIRPVGGAFLAIQVLGEPTPAFEVVVGLLAGGVALAMHGAKAGTRLMVNSSPEPISNIALSVTEDAAVFGGLVLLHEHPLLFAGILLAVIGAIFWAGPKLLRAIRAKAWFAWRKLRAPRFHEGAATLPAHLPADVDVALHRATGSDPVVEWAVPCISGRSKPIPGNLSGYLISIGEMPGRLFFGAKKGLGGKARPIECAGLRVALESGFLAETVVLYARSGKARYPFHFDRGSRPLARALAETLAKRFARPVGEDPVQGAENRVGG